MRAKRLLKRFVLSIEGLRRLSVAYCAHHDLFPGVFVKTPAARLKQFLLLPHCPHETQLNQDIFAILVNRFKPGFFLEIGANDGYTLSNSLYLEEHCQWDGLLVEANPRYRDDLQNRRSKSVIAAVVKEEGYYDFANAGLYGGLESFLGETHKNRTDNASSIVVWGTTLERILVDNNVPEVINFISIDVEGAEMPIVEQMCNLQEHRFVCGCIEHNARNSEARVIAKLLNENGYRVVWEGQTQHDLFFVDEKALNPSRK